MSDVFKRSSLSSNFSFIRFAEYRPSTFTSDFTIEIPTLAQFITDETFQPLNFVVYLELTSLSVNNISKICSRLEELLSTAFNNGKEIFRTFPPVQNSFTLAIHLLKYNITTHEISVSNLTKSYSQLSASVFKGLAWDIEKWVLHERDVIEQQNNFDITRWDLELSLKYIRSQSTHNDVEGVQNVYFLFLSCWHTEGSYEELFQNIESFPQNYVSWHYLFVLSPINSMTVGLTDLLGIDLFNLMVEPEKLANLQLLWKNKLSMLIEPILEVKITPTALGINYETATNLPFFQKQKDNQDGFFIFNLQSQRYPIRINLLVDLPVHNNQTPIADYNPVILKSIALRLRTSTGIEFKHEVLTEGTTYRLSASETLYQPERELNARMRRAQRLKNKLESILNYQSEVSAQIKKMISEPEFLEQMMDEELVQESIADLKLAFEIIDYLQEQELLLAELPPVSKKFQPPSNDNLLM